MLPPINTRIDDWPRGIEIVNRSGSRRLCNPDRKQRWL